MTKLVLSDVGADLAVWQAAFRDAAPEVTVMHDKGGVALPDLRYCMTWKPEADLYRRMPDLAALFALGAGIERFLADASIPPQVQIVKMSEPGITQAMEHYVLWQVLNHHRRFWELEAAQREARWIDQTYPAPWERKVGVLGLGALGEAVAKLLQEFGFDARGWSRSSKTIDGVQCFAGRETLDAFLDGVEILVCLLPLTDETRGILNADLFAKLTPGAGLINVGRGAHLNESDLIPALNAGRLSAASLDVMAAEPLPAGHPFWNHPRIFLTPHLAADVDPVTTARVIARQIARFEAGQPLEHVAERSRGY